MSGMPSVYLKKLPLCISKTVPLLCCGLLFALSVWMQGKTYAAFQNSLVCSTVIALFFVVIQIYKREIIDRFVLAIVMFLSVGSFAYMAYVPFLIYCYTRYAAALFFLCLAFVGVVTIMTSPTSFLGLHSGNKKLLLISSLQLLMATSIAILWSFVMHDKDLFMSVYFPYLGLCFIQEQRCNNIMINTHKKEGNVVKKK